MMGLPDGFIYLELSSIHPVINGQWHRIHLNAVPVPGVTLTMLCGRQAVASYESRKSRNQHGISTQCARCDYEFRRRMGWAIPPGHPGAPRRLKRPPRK